MDYGTSDIHCPYCDKDVVLRNISPGRTGIHFCYERAVEIMGLSGLIPGKSGQPDYDRYWKDKDPEEYLKSLGW